MKIKHHLIRKFQDAKKVPLWKWAIVIFIIVAMPLFFSLVNMLQTQQVINVDEQAAAEDNN
jgi:uncharacterized membrane protein